ncbi:hypothetical protein JMJ55_17675 [Belnapia sp. T6]|uniref:Flp family type IVb pilin n=1 Tax=Belnapia mucosa TaxID=2804532 RepID=A0ABS1V647_9PROT|nr:hypothetical protein [Belnapia mucosa]MBL6457169.1 hypothetical protein [Belnapia mucosa]
MIHSLIASAAAALQSRKGVTAAEYAVLATGIVAAVGAAAIAFGGRLSTVFSTLAL